MVVMGCGCYPTWCELSTSKSGSWSLYILEDDQIIIQCKEKDEISQIFFSMSLLK